MKKKKIALIQQPINTISLLSQSGSIEIWIYEVASRLTSFFDVVVYAKKGHYQKKEEYHKGVHYKRISIPVDELFAYILYRLDLLFTNSRITLFASSLYYFIYGIKVSMSLRVEKCDIVHIHNFSQLVPIIRAFNPNIIIVLHMHCEWLTQLDYEMIKKRLEKVDLIIGCSKYITEKIQHRFPKFTQRCITVYNGVDVNRFVSLKNYQNHQKDVKQLLFVGRVSPEKGVHVLLEAFKKVENLYPPVQLYIIGSQRPLPLKWLIALNKDPKVLDLKSFYNGQYISHLYKIASEINNKIFFIGEISHAEVIKHYQDADIFINSSFSEAFPLPILEAMASELAIVATRVGGVPEAIEHGKSGLLVEPGDSNELANMIFFLLQNGDLRKTITKVAHEKVLNLFSWEHIANNLVRQYNKKCDYID